MLFTEHIFIISLLFFFFGEIMIFFPRRSKNVHCFLKTIPKMILQRNANTDPLVPRDHRNSVLKGWQKQASSGPPDSHWGVLRGVGGNWRKFRGLVVSKWWKKLAQVEVMKRKFLRGKQDTKIIIFTVKTVIDGYKTQTLYPHWSGIHLSLLRSQKVTNGTINLGDPTVLQWA